MSSLRERLVEIICGFPKQYRLDSDANFRSWRAAEAKADTFLALDAPTTRTGPTRP